MKKEHENFVKSYAAHVNSKERLSRSNRSKSSRSNKTSVEKDDSAPDVVVNKDIPCDLQSEDEPPSFRIIRKSDKLNEPLEANMPRRRPTTSHVNKNKRSNFAILN